MKPEPIPNSARELIVHRIDSVSELDLLLFLHRHPDRGWTAGEVAAELRSNEPGTEAQLLLLSQRGFAAHQGDRFRYAAEGPLHQAVSELSRAYALYPVSVVTLIYTKPNRAVRSFAEAFRLRKEPPTRDDIGGPPRG